MTPLDDDRTRELTNEERFTWGECPVCGAEDGEKCNPNEGIGPAHHPSGQPGAHLGRIQRAPKRIKEVPVR